MNQEAWKSMGINQAESGKKHSAAAHGLNRQGTFFRLTPGAAGSIRYFVTAILALLLWFALYSVIEPTAQKITFDLLSLKKALPQETPSNSSCTTRPKFSCCSSS